MNYFLIGFQEELEKQAGVVARTLGSLGGAVSHVAPGVGAKITGAAGRIMERGVSASTAAKALPTDTRRLAQARVAKNTSEIKDLSNLKRKAGVSQEHAFTKQTPISPINTPKPPTQLPNNAAPKAQPTMMSNVGKWAKKNPYPAAIAAGGAAIGTGMAAQGVFGKRER